MSRIFLILITIIWILLGLAGLVLGNYYIGASLFIATGVIAVGFVLRFISFFIFSSSIFVLFNFKSDIVWWVLNAIAFMAFSELRPAYFIVMAVFVWATLLKHLLKLNLS